MTDLGQPKQRTTIGFLIDWLGGRYHSMIWPGVMDAAQDHDANVIIFSGGSLYSPHGFLDQRNALYDLVSKDSVDGLVIASGSLSHYISNEEFETFCKGFGDIPIVSIAQSMTGIPSVLVNNDSGIKSMVAHLVEVHNYQRIAFIRGPDEHEEAEQRFSAYKSALAEHRISYNPDLVAPGSFNRESGIEAIQLFHEERKVNFDAIIAVDDDTAIGALEALQELGYNIPGNIAVTGFDDIEEARVLSPSLTTIHQPLYRQAYTATEMLLALLDGKQIPLRTELSTELVIRQSCGCLPESIRQAGTLPTINSHTVDDQKLIEWQMKIAHSLQSNLDTHDFSLPWQDLAEHLVSDLLSDLKTEENTLFIKSLDVCLQKTQGSKNFGMWQNVLTSLRQGLWQYFPQTAQTPGAESLLGQARVMAADALERLQSFQILQNKVRSLVVDESGTSLLATNDIDALMEISFETFRNFDIQSCFIVLYDQKTRESEFSSIKLAYDQHGLISLDPKTQHYLSKKLVPSHLIPHKRRYAWVVEALYFQREQLGFVIFEIGPKNGTIYAELRRQLSSALKGALLLQEREQAEEALKNAYRELESFSYSISHDLRAPLRAISGYGKLLKSDLADQLDSDSRELLDKINDAASDMNKMIEGLLTFSRASRADVNRTYLDLSVMAESIVNILRDGNPERSITVNILPKVIAKADKILMRNVLENLLGNAWKYTSKTMNAYIEFGTVREGEAIIYYVRDNGAGFNMEYAANKIFGTFQRMHTADEFEGQGIGLATVQRIINRHGGRIWAEAEVNKGSTFYFTLEKGNLK